MNSPNSSSPITSDPSILTPVEESPNLIGTSILKGSQEYNEMLAYVNKLFSRCKKARLSAERQWYTNIAFFSGRQYVQWSSSTAGPTDRLYEPPAPSWRVRLISNKIRRIIRKELSKVTQEKPTGFVIPASSDDEDLAAARAGDMVFEYLWRDLKGNRLLRKAEFWNLLCGTAFIKDIYDPEKPSSDGSIGSIITEALSPFHIFVPDLLEEEIENQFCVIHAMSKDPEWVKSKFGSELTPSNGAEEISTKFTSALGINVKDQKDKVFLKEIWIKPGMTDKWPTGLVCIWKDDEILYAQDVWPFLHNEYPFTKLDHIPSGKFYGTSVIEDLIPLQKEYNRSRSQIVESKNRMSKPQLVSQKGAIQARKVTSEPGLIIEYLPGFQPPVPLPLQNLPSYVFDHLKELKEDMDDISSQHEVSKGQSPAGVTAATAISFLQEEDDSVLAVTISSLEEGVEKLGKHFLQHVQQHWTAERQIRIVGMNGQFEAYVFTKAALKGNTDFSVQAGSATPRSRAAKQAFIMEIGKLGWIPPEHALRFLDMTETGRLYEELQVDVRQAQRENLKLSLPVAPEIMMALQQPVMDEATGQPMPPVLPVPINNYDNDIVHITTHQTYQKTQSYELLDDESKHIFSIHVEMHKIRVAEKLGIYGLQIFDPRLDGIIAGSPAVIQGLLGMPVEVDSQQQQQEPGQEQNVG